MSQDASSLYGTYMKLQRHDAVLDGDTTNDPCEGWHNRLARMLNRHHPDLYSPLNALKKEQGDAEISILELRMGRKKKTTLKKKNGLLLLLLDFLFTAPIFFLGQTIKKLSNKSSALQHAP